MVNRCHKDITTIDGDQYYFRDREMKRPKIYCVYCKN